MKHSLSSEVNTCLTSALYGTRRFITVLTKTRHFSLSWVRSNQSTFFFFQTDFLNIHFNIFLPSTPRSSKWSLSLRFPQHTPFAPLRSPHARRLWDSARHVRLGYSDITAAPCTHLFCSLQKRHFKHLRIFSVLYFDVSSCLACRCDTVDDRVAQFERRTHRGWRDPNRDDSMRECQNVSAKWRRSAEESRAIRRNVVGSAQALCPRQWTQPIRTWKSWQGLAPEVTVWHYQTVATERHFCTLAHLELTSRSNDQKINK